MHDTHSPRSSWDRRSPRTHRHTKRPQAVWGIALAALFSTGCLQPVGNGLLGDALVLGIHSDTTLPSGRYWLENDDGTLVAYALPQRGGLLREYLLPTMPAAFDGDGLYDVSADGVLTRVAGAALLTLDEFLQTYDPRP